MAETIAVKDLMIDVFEFPHIPYWFSIRQAMSIIKKSFLCEDKCYHPMGILVFDEKYNLLGTLSLKDILKGITPSFLKPIPRVQGVEVHEMGLSALWDGRESRRAAERPVSEVMCPVTVFISPDASLTRAAYLMIENEMMFLPVLDGKKKLVGVIRMADVFLELTNEIRNG
ncbi:MAG: CBS domain-containing protein [Alphaproteobacteria bacterium]|uniref:CBS domain-containing protein n=1 Tax=Candidatus Nitrobium versatile TaxID=2884831 RepID=A0A953JAX5_9BACT|nr:CBS domain-containing protein [Candidatus Nitrobium versatile]